MKKFLDEFKAFALKGNVVDLAVAVILGGAFGKVVTGMDVITAISKMDVDANNYPRDEIYIVSARVDCYDYKPGEPKTIDKKSVNLY